MALGIKKITESVIEDGRSLIMIGTFNTAANNNTGAIENFDENRAIPIGALLSSPDGAAVVSSASPLPPQAANETSMRTAMSIAKIFFIGICSPFKKYYFRTL